MSSANAESTMSHEKMKDNEAHVEDCDHMYDTIGDHTYSLCQRTPDGVPEYATINISYDVTHDDEVKVRANVAYGVGNISRATNNNDIA